LTETIPSLAPDDLGTEFYFVGRCEEAIYRSEQIERKDGSGSFTSRSVVVRWARLGETDEAGNQREMTVFFNYPAMGKVNPNSPLGQFALACRDAGTTIKGGNSPAENAENLKKALVDNIYLVLGRSEMSPGASRSRVYTYPVKLVGHGMEYDTKEVEAVLNSINSTTADGEAEEIEPVVEEAGAKMSGSWEDYATDLVDVAVGKTKQASILAMSNFANKAGIPTNVRVTIANGKVLKLMEDAGYITTDEAGKIQAA
jgi:hypothetical protein